MMNNIYARIHNAARDAARASRAARIAEAAGCYEEVADHSSSKREEVTEPQITALRKLYIRVKYKDKISAEITLIPHFCGAVLANDFCMSALYVPDKAAANEFFDVLEKGAESINMRGFGNEFAIPIVFYDKEGGKAWTLASLIGLKPLQTWKNFNSGNTVGMFMYNPQGD